MRLYKSIQLARPLRDIRQQAAPSPAPAERAAAQNEQSAYERGRRDAERALGEQLISQRNEMLELHQGVVDSLRGSLPQLNQQTEQALVGLALEAAAKLVAGLPIQPDMVEAVVRQALTEVDNSVEMTIHLHPDDLALLRKHQSPLLRELPENGPIRFAHSSDVTRGGCLIRTRFGLLDARRETKIEQMKHSLLA